MSHPEATIGLAGGVVPVSDMVRRTALRIHCIALSDDSRCGGTRLGIERQGRTVDTTNFDGAGRFGSAGVNASSTTTEQHR